MASKWITAAPGIRSRQHPHRKHGARLDRYFTLRFSVDGRQVEEALGWASEGWTVARGQEELSRLRKAKRSGEGPRLAQLANSVADALRRETYGRSPHGKGALQWSDNQAVAAVSAR